MIHYAEATLHLVKEPSAVEKSKMVEVSDCRYGKMMYFPHDFYIGGSLKYYGEYAEEETAILLSYINEGDTVVEVGANIGCHTVPMAQKAEKVIAFEPQRVLYQMLCGNIAINGLHNVHAMPMALGKETGTVFVPHVDYYSLGNFGGVSMANEGEAVLLLTLDGFQLPRCDLIKIDVEGMESEVINGAEETIRKFRPILYVENDREEKKEALIQQIRDLDYECYWDTPKLFVYDNFKGDKVNRFGGVVSINMLCVPKEKNITPALEVV